MNRIGKWFQDLAWYITDMFGDKVYVVESRTPDGSGWFSFVNGKHNAVNEALFDLDGLAVWSRVTCIYHSGRERVVFNWPPGKEQP